MSLQPVQVNLTLWQGATFRNTFTLYQGTPTLTTVSGVTTASGTPLDLTGFTGVCNIRTAPHADPAVLSLTTANGGFFVNSPPTSGSFTLYVPAPQTLMFTWQGAVYNLLLTDNNGTTFPAGDTIPLVYGTISVQGIDP